MLSEKASLPMFVLYHIAAVGSIEFEGRFQHEIFILYIISIEAVHRMYYT